MTDCAVADDQYFSCPLPLRFSLSGRIAKAATGSTVRQCVLRCIPPDPSGTGDETTACLGARCPDTTIRTEEGKVSVSKSSRDNVVQSNVEIRKSLEKDVRAFLKAGKKIKTIPMGKSGQDQLGRNKNIVISRRSAAIRSKS